METTNLGEWILNTYRYASAQRHAKEMLNEQLLNDRSNLVVCPSVEKERGKK